MQSSPDPPVGRPRPEEGPHRSVGTGPRNGVDQGSGAVVQPCGVLVAVRGRLAVGNRSGIDEFIGLLSDDLCAPAVAAADVAHQFVQRPLRTGGNRRREVGLPQQLGEGCVLGDQCFRGVHARRIYALTPRWDQANPVQMVSPRPVC